MKAAISVEAIGENIFNGFDFSRGFLNDGVPGLGYFLGLPKRNYWVAQISGTHPKWKYERQFLRPKKDYRKSNSTGSRGIYLWYILDAGNVYEVKRPISRKRFERFFCTITNAGEIEKITEDEVNEWLKTISE